MEGQDLVDIKVTSKELTSPKKYRILYVDGVFSLRFASGTSEQGLELLRGHLRDAMHRMGDETNLNITTEQLRIEGVREVE